MRSITSLAVSLILVSVCFATTSYAQSTPPLSSGLNLDGTVNLTTPGSYDARGFTFTLGPAGEPRFTASAEPGGGCSDNWDTQFPINGTDQTVRAVVADGLGNIYIGGNFRIVNDISANYIAKWDGNSWSALGSGVNNVVFAIAISGTDVYVGGLMTSASGVPVNKVAKWNGTNWSAVGDGLGIPGSNDYVGALAVSNGIVYAGGTFNAGNGAPVRIAQWDGNTWSGLGTGTDQEVLALAASNGNIYAGGRFSSAGGVSASRIAKWNGTEWSALGGGVSGGFVAAIAVSGNDVYAGGTISGGYIAKWNGSTWQTLASGVGPAPLGYIPVTAIAVSGSDVYVGGAFASIAGNTSVGRIAKWNGSQWSTLSAGISGDFSAVWGIAVVGDGLIAGGYFTQAGANPTKNLATWTGTEWTVPPLYSLDAPARAVAVSATDVYIGGMFTRAGSVAANRIVKWNGSTWSALGSGIQGDTSAVNAIAIAGNKVYVGGNFVSAGGVNASRIAVWNGQNWSALGSGVNGTVTAIVVRGSDVYVGGDFQIAGGIATNRIAKWNGTSWSGFAGAPIPNTVTGLAFSGDDMYVSSDSTTLDTPNYLLKYDGTTWTGLAVGMGGHGVRSLAISGTDVYVSGAFQSVGGISANRVAKWNGSKWSALGSGLPTRLPGISSNGVWIGTAGNDLIASGDFSTAGGVPVNRIARWNGSTWEPLGSGLDTPATMIASAGGNIFVAGGFTAAGCNASPYFARWRETVWNGSANTDWHTPANWASGAVPPANAGVTISSSDAAITSANVTLSSLIVTGGRTVTIGTGRTLTVNGNVDLSDGSIAGPGSLVVNGDVYLDSSVLTNLASIVADGNIYLTKGSGMTSSSSITVEQSLYVDGGNITGADMLTVSGRLFLNAGYITDTDLVDITACTADAVSGGSGASFVAGPLKRCVNGSGTYRFPVGTGSDYLSVDLSNIVGNGSVTVDQRSGQYSGTASGLPVNRLQRWWQLSNSGIAQADLTLNYLNSEVIGNEDLYRSFGISGGAAMRLTTALDRTANRAVLPGVTNFSAFTLAEVDASSAPLATLTGRVTTPSGRGAERVTVTLTDAQGNSRHGMTNQSGYYWFVDLPTFQFYTLTVSSKKFRFNAATKIAQVDGNVTDFGFVSLDH